jgi:chemotaxis protein MotA
MLVGFAAKARKDGMLALESHLKDIDDSFLVKGLELAIDGQEPNSIGEILQVELESLEGRHQLCAEIFVSMGNFAPAMGLLGTLIGLVQMLQQMDDPSKIGPAMAVALLTTFYGVLLANLLFLPIAGKLKTRSKHEVLLKQLILEGVMAIQSGDNPRIVEQKLKAFVAPMDRDKVQGKEQKAK